MSDMPGRIEDEKRSLLAKMATCILSDAEFERAAGFGLALNIPLNETYIRKEKEAELTRLFIIQQTLVLREILKAVRP